ncbi:MAG: hypothetical protein QF759_11955, partial [Alphaproteobacteria bacterium]|nr:hypothetical protein [Alphaproteobacteria bacterium]
MVAPSTATPSPCRHCRTSGLLRPMEAWIPITIAAAALQTVRSGLQKHLKGQLSTTGATFSRFLYAWPLAILYLLLLNQGLGLAIPTPNAEFAM